ncbi:MAG: Cupin 2 conserved barrel domain protein [Phycisphaerales bacterium]|nr:Cupin 2 conserved barrel domain protein [Phycisphaerales bacterium]
MSGTGRARVGRRTVRLRAGSLLVIGRGKWHRVTGTGGEPMVTLNLYVPPAYTTGGDVRVAVAR